MQHQAILERLIQLSQKENNAVISAVVTHLSYQHFKGQLSAVQVTELCQQFQLSTIELALQCLPIASCYGLTPISNFNVGAVAIGISGTFYFGANQEYSNVAIAQTVHAEQSAISHAWHSNEKSITDIVVNYTPCGHCRQFLNELNVASNLKIHLPHSQNNLLHSYLPDSFGPKDLEISELLFDHQDHQFSLTVNEPVTQAALQALNQSHAPYSQAYCGIALALENGEIVTGRYVENAAFNPSFPPLQSALNYRRLNSLSEVNIQKIIMVEKAAGLSHKQATESLAKAYLDMDIEYISI
ncbi:MULTISPECIES: cytidine deaminase [Pasteurellaceae]|uniref:Cytidine deaminase n=1 Tax=Pasteurella atlantica TaxID=2827233 RepID=A0AAW8CFR9_9PAST|nr:cytidine deaminase [Pasteurella atlantica]MBR0573783.1 cytidine deaminase [Pasteurella atlantica]MDP8039719.1 cytidine deaminase [Pasteurella atlantica]MDP8041904.1 cytidine deaminase [Pasteurella atlantica]MDP8044071.1 cytidine deaminase [Pasteurella atlantica]MDP8046049.1 cytidine deaminase [Pasteurella atlantica]